MALSPTPLFASSGRPRQRSQPFVAGPVLFLVDVILGDRLRHALPGIRESLRVGRTEIRPNEARRVDRLVGRPVEKRPRPAEQEGKGERDQKGGRGRNELPKRSATAAIGRRSPRRV